MILKAVRLIVSATTSNGSPRTSLSARCTTPGPLTPTLTTHSGSPTPWNAPAMKGLSSTALAKTTIFAQPKPSVSAVSSAVRLMTWPILRTASMLMPLRVEPTLTLPHRRAVLEKASGMESRSVSSARVAPLCMSAPYPPMKLTPTAPAASSSATAMATGSSPQIMPTGVTLMRLLTIGTPSSLSSSPPTRTRSRATRVTLS